MAAFIVIDRLSVTDPEAFRTYHDLASAAITDHGGQDVLPCETQIEALEGNWKPNRIVLIEFSSADQARQWWESSEYAPARAIHRAATISNIILVNGPSCSSPWEREGDPADFKEGMQ